MTSVLSSFDLYSLVAEARESKHGFASQHINDISLPVLGYSLIASLLLRVEAELRLDMTIYSLQLAVPLGFSDTLDTSMPDLSLMGSPVLEPPSLYLFEARHWLTPTDREEYRCPMGAAGLVAANLSAVYVCGRSLMEKSRAWDFSKVMWFARLHAPALREDYRNEGQRPLAG